MPKPQTPARIAELAPQVELERLRMRMQLQALDDWVASRDDEELGPLAVASPLSQSTPRSSGSSPRRPSCSSSASSASSSRSSSPAPPRPPAAPRFEFAASRTKPSNSSRTAASGPSLSYSRLLRRRLASVPSVGIEIEQIWAAVHAPRAGAAPDREPDHLCYDRYTRSHLILQRVLLPPPYKLDALVALEKAKQDWEVDRQGAPHVSRQRFVRSLCKICASHVVPDRVAVPSSPRSLRDTLIMHTIRALDFLRTLSEAMTIFDHSIGCRRLRCSAEVDDESVAAISLSTSPLFSSVGPHFGHLQPLAPPLTAAGPPRPPPAPSRAPAPRMSLWERRHLHAPQDVDRSTGSSS
eukprot:tig00021525_g22130.t1